MSTVYLVACEETGTCKIGFTKGSMRSRLTQLRTGSPYNLKTLFAVNGSALLEKQLHERFKHLNVTREWFILCDEITLYFEGLSHSNVVTHDPVQYTPRINGRLVGVVEWKYNPTTGKWER